MNESEIRNIAAILTAGMIARNHETPMTAADAVKLMGEVADALRATNGAPNVDASYDM